jgi:hypothetical protein
MDQVAFFIENFISSIFSITTIPTIFVSAYFRSMGFAILSTQAFTILEQIIRRMDSSYVFKAEVFITRSLAQATIGFIVYYIAEIIREETDHDH